MNDSKGIDKSGKSSPYHNDALATGGKSVSTAKKKNKKTRSTVKLKSGENITDRLDSNDSFSNSEEQDQIGNVSTKSPVSSLDVASMRKAMKRQRTLRADWEKWAHVAV